MDRKSASTTGDHDARPNSKGLHWKWSTVVVVGPFHAVAYVCTKDFHS